MVFHHGNFIVFFKKKIQEWNSIKNRNIIAELIKVYSKRKSKAIKKNDIPLNKSLLELG